MVSFKLKVRVSVKTVVVVRRCSIVLIGGY